MDQQQFANLINIYKQFRTISVAPLVPWAGPEFGIDGSPRLMYVGKATNGWGEEMTEGHSLADFQSLTEDFLLNKVATRQYKSQFWYHAVDLMHMLSFGKLPEERNETTNWAIPKLYWSNLVKVGADSGNATGELLEVQKTISAQILREEISEVKPDIIVLVTGGYAVDVLYDVFGSDSWEKDQTIPRSEYEYKLNSSSASRGVFWTRHPQGWNRDRRVAVLKSISNLFSSG